MTGAGQQRKVSRMEKADMTWEESVPAAPPVVTPGMVLLQLDKVRVEFERLV